MNIFEYISAESNYKKAIAFPFSRWSSFTEQNPQILHLSLSICLEQILWR